MKKINISYIVPAYNCMNTLEDTINSIYDGNFIHGDEIVIVNDCSTDSTKATIERIKLKHSEIVVKNHKTNMGGGATRNTAVMATKCDYIFCLDSDNILQTKSVHILRNKIRNTTADVVAFEELYYFKNKITQRSHNWKFKHLIYDKQNYLTTNIVPGASGNYLFTKASWTRAGGYPEFAGALDTWGFGLNQVMSGSTMVVARKTYYFHRIGIESYWVREAKKQSISKLAAKVLLPYACMLSLSDYYRIYLKPRSDWFLKLDTDPIILNKNTTWVTGIINTINRALFKYI